MRHLGSQGASPHRRRRARGETVEELRRVETECGRRLLVAVGRPREVGGDCPSEVLEVVRSSRLIAVWDSVRKRFRHEERQSKDFVPIALGELSPATADYLSHVIARLGDRQRRRGPERKK